MEPSKLSQVGRAIYDAWASGAGPLVLGRFALLLFDLPIDDEKAAHVGSNISNLGTAGATMEMMARFAYRQIAARDAIEAPISLEKSPVVSQLVRTELEQLRLERKRPVLKPRIKMTVNGQSTSILIDPELELECEIQFGRKQFLKMAKEFGCQQIPDGVSRSYYVTSKLKDAALAAKAAGTNVRVLRPGS